MGACSLLSLALRYETQSPNEEGQKAARGAGHRTKGEG